ncbi:MAG: protease modulator HflC [Planctomycetota bacterium]
MNQNRLILVLIVLGGLLWTSAFQVAESETALVTRFGGVVRTVDAAGLAWKLPVDRVTRIDRRLRVLELDAGEILTSQGKNLEVSAFMTWTVADPERFVRSVRTVERAEISLAGYLDTEVGQVLSQRPMSDLVGVPSDGTGSKLDEVNAQLLAAVAAPAERDLGVAVTAAKVLRVGFPSTNKNSVYDRMSAERMGKAAEIRAEAKTEATEIENDAAEENQKLVVTAQNDAERIRGEAEAEAAEILRAAAELHPEFFEWLQTHELWRDALGQDDVLILEVPAGGPLRGLLEGWQPSPTTDKDV